MKEFDVFGIGNALLDILVQVEDDHLAEFKLQKGVMHLLEDKKVHSYLENLNGRKISIIPAGAVTNTLLGITSLGGRCILFGRVGKGEYGNLYEEKITSEGIISRLVRCHMNRTGKVLNLVTPDAERTFGVHLGAAIAMDCKTLLKEDIESSKFIYLTGYEYESVPETVQKALEIAKANGTRVALDLADPELIKRNHEGLKKLILDHVDILFMNEREAEAFTGMQPKEAAVAMRKYAGIAVVKVGDKGSYLVGNDSLLHIPAYRTHPIDTTGAGDLYAAGFLYSHINGKSFEQCARVGSYMGSRIITQVGAIMPKRMKSDVRMMFETS